MNLEPGGSGCGVFPHSLPVPMPGKMGLAQKLRFPFPAGRNLSCALMSRLVVQTGLVWVGFLFCWFGLGFFTELGKCSVAQLSDAKAEGNSPRCEEVEQEDQL